jgi:hypothetical protein
LLVLFFDAGEVGNKNCLRKTHPVEQGRGVSKVTRENLGRTIESLLTLSWQREKHTTESTLTSEKKDDKKVLGRVVGHTIRRRSLGRCWFWFELWETGFLVLFIPNHHLIITIFIYHLFFKLGSFLSERVVIKKREKFTSEK